MIKWCSFFVSFFTNFCARNGIATSTTLWRNLYSLIRRGNCCPSVSSGWLTACEERVPRRGIKLLPNFICIFGVYESRTITNFRYRTRSKALVCVPNASWANQKGRLIRAHVFSGINRLQNWMIMPRAHETAGGMLGWICSSFSDT